MHADCIRGLSQITFAFFGIFWPRTPLVCTFYVVNYKFFWPTTQPKCKRNLWKTSNDTEIESWFLITKPLIHICIFFQVPGLQLHIPTLRQVMFLILLLQWPSWGLFLSEWWPQFWIQIRFWTLLLPKTGGTMYISVFRCYWCYLHWRDIKSHSAVP